MFAGRSICLVILLSLCFTFSALGQELSLIYPTDKTVVNRSDFLILKGGNAPTLEEVTVEINGVVSDPIDISTAEYKSAFADFLILEPSWSPGKNTVIVKGLVGGKSVATAKAEIFYSSLDDSLSISPANYMPFVMHTAGKEALCTPCHTMQPSDAQLKNATAENNPCASCHKRMFNKKFVHGPEGLFQCVDCHDRKSSPQQWKISKPELALCGECHTDKIDEMKKNAFVHGPLATGSCTICHDPHAADQPAQLHAPVNQLCLGCHSAVIEGTHVVRGVGGKGHPLSTVNNPLRPGTAMSCVACHNPHGGAGKSFFRNNLTNRFSLCQLCHKK